MHVLAAIIAEAFQGYPVTESVHTIERRSITVRDATLWYTFIGDADCPADEMFMMPRPMV
ncbi:MAG TPA: hypothetical protein VIK05_14950 [Ilumatobacteraceae bacterium]|jgi:hypothetical protein